MAKASDAAATRCYCCCFCYWWWWWVGGSITFRFLDLEMEGKKQELRAEHNLGWWKPNPVGPQMG